jgi:hypothetical protein
MGLDFLFWEMSRQRGLLLTGILMLMGWQGTTFIAFGW